MYHSSIYVYYIYNCWCEPRSFLETCSRAWAIYVTDIVSSPQPLYNKSRSFCSSLHQASCLYNTRAWSTLSSQQSWKVDCTIDRKNRVGFFLNSVEHITWKLVFNGRTSQGWNSNGTSLRYKLASNLNTLHTVLSLPGGGVSFGQNVN